MHRTDDTNPFLDGTQSSQSFIKPISLCVCMKLIHKDLRQGNVKVEVESLDDLWFLSHIIEPADIVSTKTERKIKIGDEGDRKAKVVKKIIFLSLEVDKIEFHKTANILMGFRKSNTRARRCFNRITPHIQRRRKNNTKNTKKRMARLPNRKAKRSK